MIGLVCYGTPEGEGHISPLTGYRGSRALLPNTARGEMAITELERRRREPGILRQLVLVSRGFQTTNERGFEMSRGGRQTETGNLYGRVTDNDGERLPGVTITLSGPGATQIQVTNAEGEFRFLGLPPGNYSVEASLEGFGTVVYEAVNIRIGRNTSIEITMSPAIEEE